MLRSLSGKSHQVITGVCLTTREWQKCFAAVTDVRFAILDEDESLIMSITISPWTKPVRMVCRSGSVLSE